MDAERAEIAQHLGQHAPFDALPEALLDAAAAVVEIRYYRAGSDILNFEQPLHHLGYVRSGAVEVFRRNGDLYNRQGEGAIFGHFNLLRNNRVRFPVRALEDSLIYFLPETMFHRLCEEDDAFADFVELERPRLASAAEAQRKANDMIVTRVRKLMREQALVLESSISLAEAARKMDDDHRRAALVVSPIGDQPKYQYIDQNGEVWHLLGLLSDRDFRRALAQGCDRHTTLAAIVDTAPVTLTSDASIYEAMLCMLQHHLEHLTIIHERRPRGIVSLREIIRYETNSSLYLIGAIQKQVSVGGLKELRDDIRSTFLHLVDEGATSQMIGRAMSTIGKTTTRRLLEMAEDQLGPPPVPYCFMVNGSMARDEQSIVTDQDNALILSDDYNPKQHGEYFLALAKTVSDGLAECGYTYCKGDVMATNSAWRQPLSTWLSYFQKWIDQPTPERLLHSSIFFDLESIYGEADYVAQLREFLVKRAAQAPQFLAALARNALNRTPPLGFFRQFVMEKDGKQGKSINLKRRGTAPLIDLVRIHALAAESQSQNSFERLEDVANASLLAADMPKRLADALEYLSLTRMRAHADSLRQHKAPENTINPEQLDSRQRGHLREAFQTISYAQKFLGYRYPLDRSRR